MTDIQKENKSGGKVPNLRFPEFTEQWESKPLREVVKINQGLQIAISERSTENKTGSYFYITNEFLKAGSGKKYYILNPPQSVICNEKDILMTRTGNTGQVVTNVSGAFHNNFFKVAYPEYIDKIFLYNFLKLNKTQNQILRFAGTSTIPDLNHSDFYRIIISFPSNKEQQKIASFLS
jgi:type I restriction enzyme S subunit